MSLEIFFFYEFQSISFPNSHKCMAVISEALQLCKIHKRQFLLLQVTQEFISGTTSRTCCVSMCNDVHRMKPIVPRCRRGIDIFWCGPCIHEAKSCIPSPPYSLQIPYSRKRLREKTFRNTIFVEKNFHSLCCQRTQPCPQILQRTLSWIAINIKSQNSWKFSPWKFSAIWYPIFPCCTQRVTAR